MKIKYRLNELRKEMDLLLEYIRSTDSMTRPMVIKLCSQITLMDLTIKSIEKMPLEETEKEHTEWKLEQPSSINSEIRPVLKKKKGYKTFHVESTWNRF